MHFLRIARFATAVSHGGAGLAKVERGLVHALEMVHTVDESAGQLMLETDPSNRQARSSYVLRYQGFAEQELDAALSAAGALESELGAEGWAAVLRERKDLRLLLADSRLARDQIKAAMRDTRERQEANRVDCPD